MGGQTQGEDEDDENDGEDELEEEFDNLAPDDLEDGQPRLLTGSSRSTGVRRRGLDEFLASGSDDEEDEEDEEEDEGMTDAEGRR